MTKVIGFHYTLKNDDGEVLDSSAGSDPMLYLAGSGQILPALDTAMQTLSVGDKTSVSLVAKDGYGEVNPALDHGKPRCHRRRIRPRPCTRCRRASSLTTCMNARF